MASEYLRPISAHTQRVFDCLAADLDQRDGNLILDAGCGTGASSKQIALQHPDAAVVGVDKSAHRLRQYALRNDIYSRDNLILIRAELVDFWRLAVRAGWHLQRHYLLYPNPWPKPGHLARRWHGHPVITDLLRLGGVLELRSNWKIYVDEFSCAISQLLSCEMTTEVLPPASTISPFEKKYLAAGQCLYRCVVDLDA